MAHARSVPTPVALLVAAATALAWTAERAGAASTLSTRSADLTVIQTLVRVSPARTARVRRIRDRIAHPRPFPRALARQVTSSLVVVAAAGEVEPGTFVASLVVVHRSTAAASGSGRRRGADLEDRFARAAVARLIGVDLLGKPRFVTFERAPNLRSAPAPASFCASVLPPGLVGAFTSPSPVLHLEGTPIVPWSPGRILRSALGLALRGCGQPLPDLLVSGDVDRFADEFVDAPHTTTTSTLPEECDGTARLEAKTLTDPAHPGCTRVEWITPIPDCADDLDFDLVDRATEEPVGSVLFGHTPHVTFFFGLNPIRLVLDACNAEAGNPGGGTLTLSPVVSWGG